MSQFLPRAVLGRLLLESSSDRTYHRREKRTTVSSRLIVHLHPSLGFLRGTRPRRRHQHHSSTPIPHLSLHLLIATKNKLRETGRLMTVPRQVLRPRLLLTIQALPPLSIYISHQSFAANSKATCRSPRLKVSAGPRAKTRTSARNASVSKLNTVEKRRGLD